MLSYPMLSYPFLSFPILSFSFRSSFVLFLVVFLVVSFPSFPYPFPNILTSPPLPFALRAARQIIGSMAMFSQASPERAFAMTHAAAALRKRAQNDARTSPEVRRFSP